MGTAIKHPVPDLMLYSCTHMATVGVKWLRVLSLSLIMRPLHFVLPSVRPVLWIYWKSESRRNLVER